MLSITDVVATPRGYAAELGGGARAMLPWLAGVVPFGLVIGVAAAQANISTFAGWLTGPLIYGGSAQIAAIEMLSAGASPAVVVLTALVINLRLVLYSGAMAAYWRGTPRWWRALAAYLLIDPSFVVGNDRYERGGDRAGGHVHYLGGAVVLWVAWLLAITAGATFGAQLPAALHLEFLIPLYLIGEVGRRLSDVATRRAALTSAVVAVLAFAVPLHLGVLLAIVAGLAAGLRAKAVRR
ncbi:AzlC family ABC transporter permease [Isoptericola croceus]|uniref:AzlC family ABC transporter permease n=1 Tax=Isoptericola croceus TaxID=3031406 RepID=UPI0023F9A303|nr:AzlC family ABC transporter permease [Isoptericola croceus]